jgi:hypothetical protein
MYALRIHMAANNIQFTKIEIRIAKYLFKHYKEKYNARQLAGMLDINHAHANTLCHDLVGKNLLGMEKIGNSIIFSYAYESRMALKFMEYVLSLDAQALPAWLSELAHALAKFKDCIEMGLVFGSSIKSKDFNDIDVLLMYDAAHSRDVKKIKDEIRKSELVEKPIRYVDISGRDIMLNRGDKIFYNILSESLVFHNPEKYVEVIRSCRKKMSI